MEDPRPPLLALYRSLLESGMGLAHDPSVALDLRELDLVPDGPLQALGHGGRGIVLAGRRPGTAIKVSTEPGEGEVARRLVGLRAPGICRVISVHAITHGFAEPGTAIECELLRPLDHGQEEECRVAFRRAAYHSAVPIDARMARAVSRFDVRAGPMARSCARLGLTPDLWGDGNVMAAADGTWTLADLGPAPRVRG